MSRTDQELILARAWAMLAEPEREAIEDAFAEGHVTYIGRVGLDKLAEDWTEELRAEKAKIKPQAASNIIPFKKSKGKK